MSLASGEGDHLPAEPDALLAWASIGISNPLFLVLWQQAIDGESVPAVAWRFAHLVHRTGNKQIISSRVNMPGHVRSCGLVPVIPWSG
ncbi:MAG TPA: hypothetical protein VD863_20865, partial [Bradyrhizobium sp.]|nr:hypothetical protein [Bradyrhizobium sp.]